MLSSATAALGQMFDRKFQSVLWLSVAATIALFVALMFALQWAVAFLPTFGFSWVQDAVRWLSGAALTIGFIFLGAPVAQLFASIFIDRVADAVEAKHYPRAKLRAGAGFGDLLVAGLGFTAVSLALNLLAYPLQIAFIGVGTVVALLINGYLTGRTFFELAALRHMTMRDARALRRRHRVRLFIGGALISLLAMIPILNFFVPLFGAAMMTHEYNKLVRSE